MIGYQTNLTTELQELAHQIAEVSRDQGLDFFPTIFELVDYKQLNEIAAYGGFPTRYPHWRWGMMQNQLHGKPDHKFRPSAGPLACKSTQNQPGILASQTPISQSQ